MAETQQGSPTPHPAEAAELGVPAFFVSSFNLARRPGWERPTSEGGATWIHFGANIGATDGELSVQAASDDLRHPWERDQEFELHA